MGRPAGITAARVAKGLGEGVAADSDNAVYHIAHTAALCGRYGNMENRLLGVLVGLRIRGDATRAAAAKPIWAWAMLAMLGAGERDGFGVVGGCADTGLLQGAGGVWLEKKDGTGVGGGYVDTCSAKGAGGGYADTGVL